MRYALNVQYVGKDYAGSQIQLKNGKEIPTPTIQGELEKAICTLIKPKRCEAGAGSRERNEQGETLRNRRCERNESEENEAIYDCTGGKGTLTRKIKTVFSGRTDKGVNALCQVVHFDCEEPIVASKFLYSINEILPGKISVSEIKEVDKNFHAQKSAKCRHYRYEFINRKVKSAFDGDLLRVKYDINLERMQEALNFLLGEHDFSSFKSSGTLNPSKVCYIYKASCKKLDDKVIIDIEGNRFLYNMVRTIVGTLLEIEGHNLEASYMKEVLGAKDRTKAGKTVSPYGLTLIQVKY